jgi:hypothetical protein
MVPHTQNYSTAVYDDFLEVSSTMVVGAHKVVKVLGQTRLPQRKPVIV